MEEEAEGVLGRLFEAEIAAELLMGISKEIMQHHQILKFNLNGSLQREGDLRKLQNNMEQIGTKEISLSNVETSSSEHENSFIMQTNTLKATADSEASNLREKMHSLEEKLKDSETMLQNTKASMEESQEQRNILASEHSELKKVTDILKRNIAKAESKAESLAAKCAVLTETNVELNEELQSLRIHGNTLEKVSLLEKKLRETDIELQHAKASADASEEQQKANLELNDELKFLRTRMKCLEISLNQADDDKTATAKEISITATAISDLAMQLATERERLHKQAYIFINRRKQDLVHETRSTLEWNTGFKAECCGISESNEEALKRVDLA
ncbi:hypothetical protein IFM89_002097 [Coptis chinensis]|uniref:Uncharacterized protein n=1 Tax=Coptis chinensis TaxID=261450 RepID=A0A835LG20_9MAGN|nr:hypothetical protein IFM89_002097 [Coptis chinensis]